MLGRVFLIFWKHDRYGEDYDDSQKRPDADQAFPIPHVADSTTVRRATVQGLGDGAGDNYDAIAMAVAAVAGYGNGGVVHITGGRFNRYLVKIQGGKNPSFTLPSGVTVLMDPDVYLLVQAEARGVNGYTDALFRTTNARNVGIVGGNIKAATDWAGGVFIAIKNARGFRLSGTRLHDTHGSCRFQISHSSDVFINGIATDYEEPASPPYSFEDSLRIGSGCNRVVVSDCNLNSGDDAIALNNEPSENDNGTTGADIANVAINNINITTKAGHAVRLYQEPTMTSGVTRNVQISNVNAFLAHTVDGFSIADYSGRRAITDVNVGRAFLDCANVDGNGVTVLNAENVHLDRVTVHNYGRHGIAANDVWGALVTNPVVRYGRAAGHDGIILSACPNGVVRGGRILFPTRFGVTAEASNTVTLDEITGAPSGKVQVQ